MNNRMFGTKGESKAVEYLLNQGYKILCQNYRAGRIGELDIIAKDGETLCFIEVKTRSSTIYGTPAQSVSKLKQAAVKKLARFYMHEFNCYECPCRFDVIEVRMDRTGKVRDINIIKNAF
jgi:putative endonuclease